MHPWDKQPQEPQKWFDRFTRYRLMVPTARSMEALYRAETGGNRQKQAAVAPGRWREVAKLWNWRARAEAWDAFIYHQEQQQREGQYQQDVRAHYEHTLALARVTLNLSIRLLYLLNQRVQTLEPQQIEVGDIPAFLRASVVAAEHALNVEAHLLALDQLIGELTRRLDNEDRNKEQYGA